MHYKPSLNLPVLFALGLLLMQPIMAFAEGFSLNDALAEAYVKNPDLEAARAKLRSVDETYTQAEAGFLPSVDGVASYTSNHRSLDAVTTRSNPKSLSIEITQSLYSGGSTVADVANADNTIKAERARLRVAEQQVLLDGVTAYMTLIRDQETAELSRNNETVLAKHLKESNTRFKLGDITKTDVSQAKSRLARATADRIAAEGNLKKSGAFFERVFGLPPDGVHKPKVKMEFPATEDDAMAVALQKNPSLILAKYTEDAAKASTRSIEGENLPQVDLAGSLEKTYDPAQAAADDENTRTVELRATMPLYSGGATTSRIRQSRQTENQLRMQTLGAERAVRQAVIGARESLAVAEAESKALKTQIEAAKLALEGVKVEQHYGSRTTLDLLDAEQEYLDAQVAHISAETDRIIASYSLLAALGGLTAEGLGLNTPVYNPIANFQKRFHAIPFKELK